MKWRDQEGELRGIIILLGLQKSKIIYEVVMMILALFVAVILYIEFTQTLTASQQVLLHRFDLGILLIFAADYFIRFYLAKNKLEFFKNNIFDLIAIIPFDMTFRAARLTRLTRIGRLFRLLRISTLLTKRLTTPLGILRTNGLGKVLFVSGCLVLTGAVGIYLLEPGITTFGDSLWWSIVTTTTVGYGDISPASTGGRIIAIILMLVGIGTLGMLTGSIATFFLGGNDKEEDEIKALIHSRIDNLENLSSQQYYELLALIKSKRRSEV